MKRVNDSEVLNFAAENGMIDFDVIREKIKMNKRKKYLEMHTSKIWQSTDNKWYTFVPDCTKKDGRRLVKRKTEEEIENFLVAYYEEHREPQTIRKTYYEWADKKLRFGEISKQTYDRYAIDFHKYFCDIEDKNIEYITEDFLDDFILKNIKRYNMKAKAWSNLRTIMRGMFLYAKKKGYCKISIIEYLQELDLSKKIFNHDKKPTEKVIYTDLEINKIIEYIKNSKRLNDIAIMFAIYTGMRVGEIVALKWEDIDENFIHVCRTQIKYKDENHKNVYEIRDFPKTESGIRDVVIVPELKVLLNRLRTINTFTEYLFEKNGKCIPQHSVATRLYALCDRFEFPRKGMHSLRRYYATKLIDAGIEKSIITVLMGHSDFATTQKYYYKNNKDMKYMSERIAEVIGC